MKPETEQTICELQNTAFHIMRTAGFRALKYPPKTQDAIFGALETYNLPNPSAPGLMDKYCIWAETCIPTLQPVDPDMANAIQAHLSAWNVAVKVAMLENGG